MGFKQLFSQVNPYFFKLKYKFLCTSNTMDTKKYSTYDTKVSPSYEYRDARMLVWT